MSPSARLIHVTNASKRSIDDGRLIVFNGEIGQPNGTDQSSSAELAAKGFVGIYQQEGDATFQLKHQPAVERAKLFFRK